MVTTNAYWSGKCKLENICFQFNNFLEYNEPSLQDNLTNLWLEHKKKYPKDYDGSLLFLQDFEIEESLELAECYFFMHLSILNYSTLTGMIKLDRSIKKYGVLGSQIAIFDKEEKYILVGRRKYDQEYAPGLLTLPGGMYEVEDLKQRNFLRELYEEIDIKINHPELIALLSEHTNHSSIFLIKAKINQVFDSNQIFIENESEFADKKLFWLKLSTLKNLDSTELMEGLSFLQTII